MSTPLLAVHDEGDRIVPFGELDRIAGAHDGARILPTRGFGHNRLLEADPFLDAVLEFLAEPVRVVLPVMAAGDAPAHLAA